VGTLPAVTRSGYTFDGWNTVQDGSGSAFTGSTTVTGDITVYAQWAGGAPVPETRTVIFNLNGGTWTGGGALSQDVTYGGSATAPVVTRNGYTFDGWDRSFTNVTANITVNALWTQIQTGGGSDRDSDSGGSSGGSGGSTGTTTPPTTWIGTPNANGRPSRSEGKAGVRGSDWAKLGDTAYQHDTMDGNSVQVRITIDDPNAFKSDTMLSAYVKGADVDRVNNVFNTWFDNTVQSIHFDQQTDWDAPVRVAAKVDLTDMDTDNLVFYAYDREANRYKRIENPEYRIDANGYLWFTTPYAGSIVISDGRLVGK
jgi:uncharacterized repeat protein (TIGR02543 family)